VERRAQASKSFANACGSRQATDSTASLLWYSAAQHALHALHSTGNGSAGPGQGGVGWPGSRKTFKSSRPLPLPARTPPCARSLPQGPSTRAHRQPSSSSPLAAQHSAAVSLVPDSLLLPVGLLASFCCHPHTASLLLHFFLNTLSLTGSIIDKFDIAARSILLFIPSCLDLVVRLSLSYRHRQSRHSLRESKNNRAPTDS
jgi:hypothetical protein